MTKKQEPYFTPMEDKESPVTHNEPIKSEAFFTHLDSEKVISIPDTINAETILKQSDTYQFHQESIPNRNTVRRLFFTFTGLFTVILGWQTYSFMLQLFNTNVILGSIFGVLLVILLDLVVREGYQFRQGQLQFQKIEDLRDKAETFTKEHSQGKSSEFITLLSSLYEGKPQQSYLMKVIDAQADYLNDAEVITDLSKNFLSQLDKEALEIVKKESLSCAAMIAVSQVPIIDSLIVVWKNMRMVNKINSIYGLSLTRLGQWQLFVRIVKATLLAAGSQKGMNLAVANIATLTQIPGTKIITTVSMSLVQGLGVGTYVAKIGVEAMKQNRPVPFEESESPKINLITEGLKTSLGISKTEEEQPIDNTVR